MTRLSSPTLLSAGVAILSAAVLLQGCSRGATPSASPQRISGTVQSLDGQTLTVATASGAVTVQLTATTPIAQVVAADRSQINGGSFLGIGSAKQPDGSLRAVEITIFPESMRGTGEGNYAWNHPALQGGGQMTNGTAASMQMTNGTAGSMQMTNGTANSMQMTNGAVSASRMTNGTVAQAGGESITLSYKDGASTGTQAISIPADVPIVSLAPGQQSDLTPGAHVIVFVTPGAGASSAARVLVGKDGLVPPQ